MSERNLTLHPGVAAVVFDDQRRVLLHRRKIGGGWAPPSGRMEPGESVLEGLERELEEETRLTIAVEHLIGVYSDLTFQTVAYPDGRYVQFITTLFACRLTGGRLRGSDEATDWDWFPAGDLPSGLLPYAEVWLRDAFAPAGAPFIR